MNPQTDSLKLLALLAVLIILGGTVYYFSGNRNLDQSGRALNTERPSTEELEKTSNPPPGPNLLPCTITSFKATPASVASGASSLLSWSTQNCMTNLITQASTPVITSPLPSGQVSTGPLTTTKTYLLTAVGENNSTTASTTVTVGTLQPCTINTFTTTPSSIPYNTASTMAWTTSNCTSASISPTIGSVPTNGSISSGNLTTTTTFTLTATSSTNTTTSTKTITVIPPPQCAITLFSATPSSITSGQASTLNWKTTNCNTGLIDQGIGSITPTIMQGSISTGPLTSTKTFKLTATGINNTVVAQTVVTVMPPACTPNTWTQKADFGGTARNSAVGFSIGSKGYIGTGYDTGYKNDFWEYDPSTNTWTQKADFGGVGRSYAANFSIGTKGYVGMGAAGVSYKDFWEYDPSTNTWTQKADFGGGLRHSLVNFTIGSKGYAGTGHDYVSLFQDLWQYDPSTNTWTQKANFPGDQRYFATGFSIGTKGYLGIGQSFGGTNKKDFWEYDSTTNIWTQKSDFGGGPKVNAASFSINGKGYIGTGNTNQLNTKDFWQYDPAINTWTQKTDFGGIARNGAVGFSINGKGYIGTGNYNGPPYLKDFWEYCP